MFGRSLCPRVSWIHRIAVLLVLACSILPGQVRAVPANPEAVYTLSQPDGSTFPARLAGDEWAHWYEAEGRETVVQDAGGLWCYAAKGPDGQLASSGIPVGEGAAAIEPHLRPDPSALKQVVAQRDQTWPQVSTLASITGTAQAVIILVEFSDTPAGEGSTGTHTPAYFDDPTTGLVLGSDPGKMKNYYSEVSYGQLNIQGVVANSQWHQVAQTESFYGGDCSPGQTCSAQFGPPTGTDNCNLCIYELARQAIQAADSAGFDFAPYDTDADGVIDHVIIVHAGQNQASLGGSPSDIWSHRWSIPGAGQAVDGKVVKGYTMVSEHDAMSVLAHEFAHDLGAPDLYDYGQESTPVGKWCLMSYNFESDRPAHLCGLLKVDLDGNFDVGGRVGWATPTLLTTQGTYSVARLDQNATGSIYMTDPVFSGKERFLLENRSRSGYYDYSVPEPGILITHLDMDMATTTGRLNEGPPAKTYYCAWVERPLNMASPDGAAYSAEDGETRFDPSTIPNTNANGGVGTGKVFQSIGPEGDAMSFAYRTGPTSISGNTSGHTRWTRDGSPYVIQTNFTVSNGDSLVVDPGVVVKFQPSTRLIVLGTIVAQGALGDTIAFTSIKDDYWGGDTNANGPSSGAAGDWQNIWIDGPDAPCSFAYCVILYAGQRYYTPYTYAYYHAIYIQGTGAQLSIVNTSVSYTFGSSGSSEYPYAIWARSGTNLQMSGVTVRNSSYDAIVCDGNATIAGSLITSNGRKGIECAGVLTLLGSRILGNGSTAVAASGAGSSVSGCRIANNSGGLYGLYLSGASCRIVADTLDTNNGSGIVIPLGPTECRDNVSTGNTGYGYAVPAPWVDDVWLANTMGPNGHGNAIGVYAGTVSSSTQWIDEHPYAIWGNVTIPDAVTLALEPGCILKFYPSTRLITNGTLVAEGEANDPIVFTSYRDDLYAGDTNGDGATSGAQGDWQSLWFDAPDAGCSLSNCVILYAGQRYYTPHTYAYYHAIYIQGTGAQLSIVNTSVSYTFGSSGSSEYPYAIWARSGTNLQMSGVTIHSSSYDAIQNDGTITMSGCQITSSGRYGISNTGALTVLSSQILSSGSRGLSSSGTGTVVRNSRFSGNASEWGLYLAGSSPVAVADTCYSNSAGLGFANGVVPAEFHDNVSYGNTTADYLVPPREVDDVWLENHSDDSGVIGITSGNLEASSQWIDDFTYHIYNSPTIPADRTLTIEPGAVFKFSTATNLTVNGVLVAEGMEGDEIIFTSMKDDTYGGDTNGDGATTPAPGEWQQLRFVSTNAGCTMQHCKVRYAGGTYGTPTTYSEGVHVDAGAHLVMGNCEIERTASVSTNNYALGVHAGSDLNLANCYVHHNNGNGIYIAEPTTPVVGCLAANHPYFGFYVHPELVGEIAAVDSLSANGYTNAIGILGAILPGGTITQTDFWPAKYPYVVNAGNVTVNAGATLVINKGAVVKFNGDRTLEVKGNLQAQGDATEKVIFTSFKDDNYGGDTNGDQANSVPAAGDWRGIYFNGAGAETDMGWAVVSYGGLGVNPAMRVEGCSLNLQNCIIHSSLGRGIRVSTTGQLVIQTSDIYSNAYGLENLSTINTVDARNCWWGSPSGPYHATTNPAGQGNQVSNMVNYSPWLERSIDNPWHSLVSPVTTGNYEDVLVFDLDGDPLLDLIAATESNGIQVFRRTGFETWEEGPSPITTGQCTALDKGDFDNDSKADLMVCGSGGIRCFRGGMYPSLPEVDAPLVGLACADGHLAYLDHDQNLDVVGCSGNNGGIWVFHGDGAGHWSPQVRPTTTGTYFRVRTRDLNNDSWTDIIAASGEYQGIRIWYGSADGTWTPGQTIADGQRFYGLDVGDIGPNGPNGTYDIVAGGIDTSVGIKVYLNSGDGTWTSSPGPVASGLFYDVKLRDLDLDGRLDLAAANHSGGVNVWLGTSALLWNYWYKPISQYIFKRLCIDDFTLNGSPDIAAASVGHGIYLWDNLNPGGPGECFDTSTDLISFGQVAIGNCAHEAFTLTNVTADTLENVYVYATDPAFQVAFETREEGPFTMLPNESRDLRVTFCPTVAGAKNELVVIHSTQAVTHVRVTGQGVTYISPVWSVPIEVENAVGGPDNSQTVTFGGGIGATDGRDVQAGEVCLPPWPPETVFDARFDITGCDGSLINVHDYYADRDTFLLKWQPGSAGYPMTISWNPATLPEGTFLISDTNPGVVYVDTLNMATSSQVVIPAGMELQVTELAITTTRLNNFTYNLNQGWNLISRPISMDQDSLAVLFPGALSAFGWSNGYQQVQQLATGNGYWLNMNAVSHPVHKGSKFTSIHKTLPAGWSLVGAVYDTVLVSQILQNPPNSIVSYFSFNGHYEQATSLIPGQGYWFDLSQPCEITIEDPYGKASVERLSLARKDTRVSPAEHPATKSPTPLPGHEADPTETATLTQHWALPIAIGNFLDGRSGSQVLQFGFDEEATNGIDPALGELDVPPMPPTSVFEARMTAQDANGLYLDLRRPEPGNYVFEIIWQAGLAGYPIRLQWDRLQIPAGLTLTLTDNLDGSFLGPIDMSAVSTVTISEEQAFLTGVRILASMAPSAVDGASGVTRFDLMQNVPNPLSGDTWIRYALPTQTPVELVIHDVTGRMIRVLARGAQPAGIHSVLWDGRDDTGASVAAGVYFYRLKAEGFEKARKLLVVR